MKRKRSATSMSCVWHTIVLRGVSETENEGGETTVATVSK